MIRQNAPDKFSESNGFGQPDFFTSHQRGMVNAKISSEMVPSETLVTGPVIKIEKPSPIVMEIFPPGMFTVIDGSQNPSLCATAAAALLLLPEASVLPAPRSQISI